MAEVIGLVGSLVGIAGFAGQLAQGSAFLYHFFNDYKDVPNEVKRMIEELKLLETLLRSIQQTCDAGNDQQLEQALQNCGGCINEILLFVKDNNSASNMKGYKKTWKKFRFTLQQPQIRRYLLNLERAKSTLLQSCANSASKREVEGLQGLNFSISNLSLRQESVQAATSNMQTSLREIENSTSSLASSSARITQVATETYDLVKHLTEGTRQIQDNSKKIDVAANKLVGETLELRPALLKEIGKEIRRTINKNLQQHLDKSQESMSLPNQKHSKACLVNAARKQTTGLEGFAQSHNLSNISSQDWEREGSQGYRRELINNTLFGTLVLSTTAITYVRQNWNRSLIDKKIISDTVVTFHPALWLFSRGVVLKIQAMKFLGRQNCSSPQFSLSTVNVRPFNSEIFRACINCDLNKIRELFDEGSASPYDVDEYGKNLLGFVGMGAALPKKATGKDPVVHLADLFAVVKYLIDFGIDTGTLDNRLNIPIMTFLSHWFYSGVAIPEYEDHFQYLFNTLLNNSKSDPFITSEAFIYIKMDTPYILLEFLPGPHFLTYSWLPALEAIIRQNELIISWSPENVPSLCNAGATYLSCETQNTAHAREYVSFWVLGSTIRIEGYLDAKSNVLTELLTHDRLQDSVFGCTFRTGILEALKSGFEIIALLTEWLQNPTRRLGLVLDFMNRVVTLLLVHGSRDFEKLSTYEEISRQVLTGDMRIVDVWKKALREARNKVRGSNFRRYFVIAAHLHDLEKGKHKVVSEGRSNIRGHRLKANHNNVQSTNLLDNPYPQGGTFTDKKQEKALKEIEKAEKAGSEWETDEETEENKNLEAMMSLHSLMNTTFHPVATLPRTCSRYEHCREMNGDSGNFFSQEYARILGMESQPTENPLPPTGKLRWIAGVLLWILHSIV